MSNQNISLTDISAKAPFSPKTFYQNHGVQAFSILVLTNVISTTFPIGGDYVKWVALVFSMLICIMADRYFKRKLSFSNTLVSFFNGLILYATACGFASVTSGVDLAGNNTTVKQSSFSFFESKIWWEPIALRDTINSLESEVKYQIIELEKYEDNITKLNDKEAISADSIKLLNDKLSALELMVDDCGNFIDNLGNTDDLPFSRDIKGWGTAFEHKKNAHFEIFKANGLYGLKQNNTIVIPAEFRLITKYMNKGEAFFITKRSIYYYPKISDIRCYNEWEIINEKGKRLASFLTVQACG